MRIALVHDYLREYGGAERVVEVMHTMWPEAPLYTSFVDWDALGEHAKRFHDWDIRTSWVQQYPFIKKYISPLRFLAPKIWDSFDLSAYDVVISSSGWFMCRGVTVSPDAVHVCYIHHPPRNLYGYATGSTWQKYWFVRVYATIINFFLRQYDYQTAQKVQYFVANSAETARRVQKFYRRGSTVIYPPVDVSREVRKTKAKRTYFLSVGRLTYAKQIDLAIHVCNVLQLPLKIVGVGKEETYLRSIAGPTVEFTGAVSDAELKTLYAEARALLFCALDEDFGIVPVEAMAHGTPVIALAQGGVKETVVEGKTGLFFAEPTVAALQKTVEQFLQKKNDWEKNCLTQAAKFSEKVFRQKLDQFIQQAVKKNL